jgi:dethiobiotin synthetase
MGDGALPVKDFFVTGTNTEVGKTWVSRALLLAAKSHGLRTIAVKPIAAGCERTPGGLRNEDALLLQDSITESLHYQQINPVALEPPIAPHIAAQRVGLDLTVAYLAQCCAETLREVHDFALVEGAGGWRVPVNRRETLADLAVTLQLPVILVVGMELGCLNHALLTAEAIRRDGLRLAGWVANSPGPAMPYLEENLASLRDRLAAPLLGQIPLIADHNAAAAANLLDLAPLLNTGH